MPRGVRNSRQAPKQERPRLVFFHSKRDGRSRRVEGFIAQVLQRRKNHDTFVVHSIEVAERPDLAERFRIDQVPALLVIAERRVQGRLVQPHGCRQIEELLAPWLREEDSMAHSRQREERVGSLPACAPQ